MLQAYGFPDPFREFFVKHSIRYQKWIVLAGLVLALPGCGTNQSMPRQESAVVLLPAQLAESSGLVCVEDEFISFNDSGGLPVLYRFDQTGQIQQQLKLKVENTDWEAISSDGEFLYLADVGNNAGKRSSLQIHKIPLNWSALKQPYLPDTVQLSIPELGLVNAYQHDLDFEAIGYHQQQLWLFSKSWASGKPSVYRLDPALTPQDLGKPEPVQSPDFLMTDASYDSSSGHWWLVGYPNPFQAVLAHLTGAGYQPQLAKYNSQFQLLEVKALPTTGQVEGLCIDRHQQIWISEETSQQGAARLIKTGLSSK
jgi:hypothetical protein